MERFIKWAALAGGILITFASCAGLMTPEQAESLRQVWTEQLANGQLTQEQYDVLVATLKDAQSGGVDWGYVSDIAVTVGLAVVASFTGVTIHRGTPNNRKGKAPQGE